MRCSTRTLVVALGVLNGLTVSSQDHFRRGSTAGGGAEPGFGGRAAPIVFALAWGEETFFGCSFQEEIEAADVNDNEFLTVADDLLLEAYLRGEASIPEPSGACGFDPSDDRRGFDGEDAAFGLTTSEPRRDGDRIYVDLLVKSPWPFLALTGVVDCPQGMYLSDYSVEAPFDAPGTSFAAISPRSTEDIVAHLVSYDPAVVFPATGDNFAVFVTLELTLVSAAAEPRFAWLPEAMYWTHPLRATVVTEDFEDHHPVIGAELPPGGPVFLRGNVNGDRLFDLSDGVFLLQIFGEMRSQQPRDCGGAVNWDAADVNDNEHFTIADPLWIFEFLVRGAAAIPEPEPRACFCGPDPTDSARGFDAVDPAYALRAYDFRVAGDQVEIDLEIKTPQALQALTFSIEHTPAMEPWNEAFRAAQSPFWPSPSVFVAEQTLVFTFSRPVNLAGAAFPSTGDVFARLGTLHFTLTDPSAHAGMEWLPEPVLNGIALRATCVTTDFADHHPALLVERGVPGLAVTGGFVRGDVDADGFRDHGDAVMISRFLWEGGPEPKSCDRAADLDAADVNDNESITIADVLFMEGDSFVPAPRSRCGRDPTDGKAGFDQVDSAYVVKAGAVSVVPPTGNARRDVFIPIHIDYPDLARGLQLLLDYDETALTPFSAAEGGAFASDIGVPHFRVLPGGVLAVGLEPPSQHQLLVNQTGAVDLEVGILRFHLAERRVFPPIAWLAEYEAAPLTYRASIVDAAYADHHPELRGSLYRFARGNSNGDTLVDISDPRFTLDYLFSARGRAPNCFDAADANNDGDIDLSDAIYTLAFLFLGGPPMPAPFPQCGLDSDIDLLDCQPALSGDACHEE